ncbi:NBS-LRR resistance-like protein, partial [Tanacetum coccineum]
MAETIASAILKPIFQKLADEGVKQVGRVQGIHSELESLEKTLFRIQALLVDASDKEIKDVLVQNWLNDLKHLAYDIDDILDDLETDDMHPEFVKNSGASTSKKAKKTTIGLYGGLEVRNNRSRDINRDLETSVIDASASIVGRQDDKDELINKLLGDDPRNKTFSIVPIVGMGGVGKTTLAKMLYNDKQVNSQFELKAWVCVSDPWDGIQISRSIFQS